MSLAMALILCSMQRVMAESVMALGRGKLDSGTESSVVIVVALFIDFKLDGSCFAVTCEIGKGGLHIAPAVLFPSAELLFRRVRPEVTDFGRGRGLAVANSGRDARVRGPFLSLVAGAGLLLNTNSVFGMPDNFGCSFILWRKSATDATRMLFSPPISAEVTMRDMISSELRRLLVTAD